MHAMKHGRDYCKLHEVPGIKPADKQVAECEIVNLGCLSRRFTWLDDPKGNQLPYHRWSISRLLRHIRSIASLEDMGIALGHYFVRNHNDCSIGHRLTEASDAMLLK